MDYNRILYEASGTTARIVLNVPEERNCISTRFIDEVQRALTRAEEDLEVRAVVIIGTGSAFCAGADLKMANKLQAAGEGASTKFLLRPLTNLLRNFRNSPLPIIAAVNGYCLAGGMEMLLCCDLVVAADSAVFGDQHAVFGLLPAIGGAQGLLRALGTFKAKEMMLTGQRYSAREMEGAGLVNIICALDALQETAQTLADGFATKSPEGIARMKQMLNSEYEMAWEAAATYEMTHAMAHQRGEDIAEGTLAFIEKRRPTFKRR